MERISTASTRVGLGLIAAVFAANVYRAATQSFTTDEAFTFLAFVSPRWIDTWRFYDANNHVLNSLLARLAMKALGGGEFALRLPSLLAGGLYLAGAYVLTRRVFRTGPLFLPGLALMALNPLVLDHLVACRGYGMALAGWIWGLLLLWDHLEKGAAWRMQAGAMVLALAVCANLAFLFPVAATALVFGPILVARRGRGALAELADRFAVPAVVVGFVILCLPMLSIGPGKFYYGSATLSRAVGELTEMSFFRPRLGDPWLARYMHPLAVSLALAAMAAAAWLAAAALRRRLRRQGDVFLLLWGGTAVLALVLILAAHYATGMPFPENRTALYWVPLLSIVSLTAVREAGRKPLTVVAILATALLAGRYVQQTRLDSFGEWPQDYGIARISRTLQREAGNGPVRVCAVHARAMTLRYYRLRLGMPGWTIEAVGQETGPCDWSVVDAWKAPPDGSTLYRDKRLALVRQVRTQE